MQKRGFRQYWLRSVGSRSRHRRGAARPCAICHGYVQDEAALASTGEAMLSLEQEIARLEAAAKATGEERDSGFGIRSRCVAR
jgi:hypothetical protein